MNTRTKQPVSTWLTLAAYVVVPVAIAVAASTGSWAQTDIPNQPNLTPAPPQPQVHEKSHGKPLKQEVDMVLVNASVTDPYGRLVTGLEQNNFRVYEDNSEQELVHFSSEDVPISIGIIFDMSGSMADKFEKCRLAAVQFFKTSNPKDEFFLVDFNDRAQLASPFTDSVDELQNRLMFTSAHGRTALLDGIYLGLSQMKAARNTKRALLIISDGGDNHSRYTEQDIRNYIKEADVQLYAIGIYEPAGYCPTPEECMGPSLLGELTEMTGGRTYRVNDLNELPDIATKISMELRNQYVIGYQPSNRAHDGKWRKIKVKLRPRRGFRLSQYLREAGTLHRVIKLRSVHLAILSLFLCALGVAGGADSQEFPSPPPPPPSTSTSQGSANSGTHDQKGVIKREADLVVLRATVVNDKGDFVPGLKESNFRVFEDKAEQKISVFDQEDVPVTIGLVIDNSGSMREKRPQVNAAALALVQTSNPQDEVFVVNFNDEYYLDLDQDFTNDPRELKEALDRIDSRGSTALYDALIGSLDHLKKGHKDKRVLVVVTDGDDDASRKSFEYTLKAAEQSNAVIYAVGVFSEDDRKNDRRMVKKSKRILTELADSTGGMAYFPDNLSEVGSVCTQIARDIRNQYTLGYHPSNDVKDGTFRNVRVDIIPPKGAGKLSVRTRTGYYADKSSSAAD